MYVLAVSGHFPREHRSSAWRARGGAFLIWSSMAITAVAALFGVVIALRILPWYAAVIGGGAAILAAPLLLQAFPDRIVDGRQGLFALTVLSAALARILARLTGAL
jgi:hypothetical protein